MDCCQVESHLIDFIEKNINETKKEQIELHIEKCVYCQNEIKKLKKIYAGFENIETIKPSIDFEAAFIDSLGKRSRVVKPKRKLKKYRNTSIQVAASLILFVAGFYLGVHKKSKNNPQLIASLMSKNTEMKESLTLALIDNNSASKRVKGINFADSFQKKSNLIADALIKRMIFDENINVKLAAVETLGTLTSSKLVMDSLVNTLKTSNLEEIQIAIIEVLARTGHARAVKTIHNLLKKESTPPTVKEYIKIVLSNA